MRRDALGRLQMMDGPQGVWVLAPCSQLVFLSLLCTKKLNINHKNVNVVSFRGGGEGPVETDRLYRLQF